MTAPLPSKMEPARLRELADIVQPTFPVSSTMFEIGDALRAYAALLEARSPPEAGEPLWTAPGCDCPGFRKQEKNAHAHNCPYRIVKAIHDRGSEVQEIPVEPKQEEAGEVHLVTLTGYQLREALQFIAPDQEPEQLEAEISIEYAKEGHSGAGYYCCMTEYPEEGGYFLDAGPPENDGAHVVGPPLDVAEAVAFLDAHPVEPGGSST